MISIYDILGDLFTSGHSMVHCVSADLRMSRGIAVKFKQYFGAHYDNVGFMQIGDIFSLNHVISISLIY